MSQVTDNTSTLKRAGHKIPGRCEWVSECYRYEMSQWSKYPVEVSFGSKCSEDVPLAEVLSMHLWLADLH
jgi:hypothetical protein